MKENGATYIKEVFNAMSPQRSFLRNPISTFCVPGSHEIFPSVFSMFTKKYHVINKYNQWASSDEREREREEWGASADKWDMNENASPFAWWFQVLESLHVSEYVYWFNVWKFESVSLFWLLRSLPWIINRSIWIKLPSWSSLI